MSDQNNKQLRERVFGIGSEIETEAKKSSAKHLIAALVAMIAIVLGLAISGALAFIGPQASKWLYENGIRELVSQHYVSKDRLSDLTRSIVGPIDTVVASRIQIDGPVVFPLFTLKEHHSSLSGQQKAGLNTSVFLTAENASGDFWNCYTIHVESAVEGESTLVASGQRIEITQTFFNRDIIRLHIQSIADHYAKDPTLASNAFSPPQGQFRTGIDPCKASQDVMIAAFIQKKVSGK